MLTEKLCRQCGKPLPPRSQSKVGACSASCAAQLRGGRPVGIEEPNGRPQTRKSEAGTRKQVTVLLDPLLLDRIEGELKSSPDVYESRSDVFNHALKMYYERVEII